MNKSEFKGRKISVEESPPVAEARAREEPEDRPSNVEVRGSLVLVHPQVIIDGTLLPILSISLAAVSFVVSRS